MPKAPPTSVPVVNPLGRPPPTPSLAEDDPAYGFRPAKSEVSALRVRVHTTHRVRAPLAQRSDNAFFYLSLGRPSQEGMDARAEPSGVLYSITVGTTAPEGGVTPSGDHI